MVVRFRSSGANQNEIRAKELALAKKKASPGYQIIDATINTVAQSLGALAVNAASYELFGGREKTELAAKNFEETARANRAKEAFDRDKFEQKQYRESIDKVQAHGTTIVERLVGSQAFSDEPSRNAFNAAVKKHRQPGKQVTGTKRSSKDAQGRPRPGVTTETVVEGVDPYEGLTAAERDMARIYERDFRELAAIANQIKDPAEKQAFITRINNGLQGVTGTSGVLAGIRNTPGGKVNVTKEGSITASTPAPRDRTAARNRRGQQLANVATNASARADRLKQAIKTMSSPNVPEGQKSAAAAVLAGEGIDVNDPVFNWTEAADEKLAQLIKGARDAKKKVPEGYARSHPLDPNRAAVAASDQTKFGGEVGVTLAATAKESGENVAAVEKYFRNPQNKKKSFGMALFRSLHEKPELLDTNFRNLTQEQKDIIRNWKGQELTDKEREVADGLFVVSERDPEMLNLFRREEVFGKALEDFKAPRVEKPIKQSNTKKREEFDRRSGLRDSNFSNDTQDKLWKYVDGVDNVINSADIKNLVDQYKDETTFRLQVNSLMEEKQKGIPPNDRVELFPNKSGG